MVNWFETNYAINASRIYATGMSNGAMFSYFLAFNLTGVFAGIAPVTGPMDLNLGWNATTPPAPTTVIAIRSPTDPIIPPAGQCSDFMCNNYSYSDNDTIAYWCGIDGINMTTTTPVITVWSDDDIDTSTITRYVYGPGTNGTQVVFFKEEGSVEGYAIGHTWPGGPQYQPASIIGAVSNQIDGSAQIWRSLPPLKYCLTVRSTSGGSVTSVTAYGHKAFTNVADEYGINTTTTMFFYPGSGNSVVNLVAQPLSEYYKFVKWTGDVSTIDNVNAADTTITITPNKDYEIKANFQLKSEGGTTPPSGGCFIATAAYGTPTAKQLDVLRAFRDDVLLKSTVGSRLVDFYYRTSPPIADFISQHSVVRTLVRELLIDPIVWVVQATGNMWQS
jgi:hypothetical protein